MVVTGRLKDVNMVEIEKENLIFFGNPLGLTPRYNFGRVKLCKMDTSSKVELSFGSAYIVSNTRRVNLNLSPFKENFK